jgi:TruD family tRNA pseudouridine synthase
MVSLEEIGISNFQSYNLKGKLFEREEDFKVQEIEEDGTVLKLEREEQKEIEGEKKDYLLFTLVKRGISTPEAVKLISRALHISFKRIAYNGNKDKRALTSQRMSIFKLDAGKLKLESERMFFRDIGYSNESCKIGKLYGNHFTVKVKNLENPLQELQDISEEVAKGVPNFYGPQRFGASSLNIEISKSIIKRDFKSAFYDLVLKERAESQLNQQKRAELRSIFSVYVEGNQVDNEKAKEALSKLPNFMYFERDSLQYLLQHKNDYIGAIRMMPKYIRLLIIQSYQYYIFNRTLSSLLENKKVNELESSIPTIGYDIRLNDDEVGKTIKEILKQEGVEDLEMLKINSMPEASLKSFMHPSFVIPENFRIEKEGENAEISFDLKKGSYATILLMKLFGIENVYRKIGS